MSEAPHQCSDCRCELEENQLISYANAGVAYARERTNKGALVPSAAGLLVGLMCPDCGRVQLYAKPFGKQLPPSRKQ